MRNITVHWLSIGFAIFLSWTLIGVAHADAKLKILTEEDPPYSFTGPNGKPSGYGVDVVTEIQRRLGVQEPIEIYPWARAYDTIKRKPNVVVFTMSRTKEREPLFQWVGPVIENGWVFLTKKGSGVKITSLEDAKKLRGIGVVKDYAWDAYLTGQGFSNLERVVSHTGNIKKLDINRLQAIVVSDLSYRDEIIKEQLNPDDFEILYLFNAVQMYIAHSKDTDRATVDKWHAAFSAMKQDGTLSKILKKWIPSAKLPGAAKAASF